MRARRLGTLVLLALLGTGTAYAAGTLQWRAAQSRVDADIDGWPLATLLEEIATQTGWQVFAEPGTRHTVATRFERLGTVEALDRLLRGLSFALLPQEGGPAKLIVYRSSAERATERIYARARAAGSRPIADERIVVLKDGADAERLARRLGASIVGRLDALGAYRLRFATAREAADAARALADDPEVESVEANQAITPPGVLEPLAASGAGASRLRPDITPSPDGVVVGLIDTAVQTGDDWLRQFLQAGIAVAGDYQPPPGAMTHGTAMAATILDGVAAALAERGGASGTTGLSILPVDVYGANERTSTFAVAQGLYEALSRHVNVVNLSLAGDTDSQLLSELTRLAAAHGVVVVAAAGNTPVATPTFPAADPGVIAVTASDARGGLAAYANTGGWVDAMAPGDNLFRYLDQLWHGTGTSVSTGWVSGWAAGFMTGAGGDRAGASRATLDRWPVPAAPAKTP